MSALKKSMVVTGLTGRIEPSYATPAVIVPATDGILMALSDRHAGLATLDYLWPGDLGPAPGNRGNLPRRGARGRFLAVPIPTRPRGPGAAYSATVLPSEDVLQMSCGFARAIVTTPGAERVTYTPELPGTIAPTSSTLEYFKRGEKWTSLGTLGTFEEVIDSGGPATRTWSMQGIGSPAITDEQIPPTIDYPLAGINPPRLAAVTLGAFTAIGVRRVTFNLGAELTARPDWVDAVHDGHGGFFISSLNPTLAIELETPSLVGTPFHAAGGIDPYQMLQTAPTLAVSYTLGTVQYNTRTVEFPQAQLLSVEQGNDGAIALTTLTFQATASKPGLNDLLSEVWA